MHIKPSKTPHIKLNKIEECNALCPFSMFFSPTALLMTIFAPIDKPKNTLKIKLIKEELGEVDLKESDIEKIRKTN